MKQTRPRSLAVALACAALAVAGCEQSPLPFGTDEPARGYTAIDAGPSAVAYTGAIRIGVVPSASSVTIGAAGPWELVEKASGDVVLTGSDGSLAVSIETPATIVIVYGLQIVCGNNLAAIADLLAPAEAAGFATEMVFNPVGNCTRGLIISPENGFAYRVNFRNARIADGLAPSTSFWHSYSDVSAAVLRVAGGATVFVDEAAILRSDAGRVTINGSPYRGIAEVAPNSGGTLAGINSLPMDDYLYGVVPRELPPTVYGEIEALKAQAVAARTYAMRGLGKRAANGYDLLATTQDQVYGGIAAEHPLSSQAVDETVGIVANYNGKLIEALYSSTSGGFTANNEEVYNSAPVPYLRGAPDAQRGDAFENVPTLDVFKRHSNPRSLRGYSDGDFEADWSRYHRWTFEWSAEEIRGAISAWRGTDVGTVHEINVLDRGPSGRVIHIEYVTDAGTFTSTKDAIRSSLRFINASGGYSSMLSTLFYIEPVVDRRSNAVTGYVAWGGGWGHGVGMSQTGAVGMAVRKATYEEILRHYYRDITLDVAYTL